MDTNNYYREQWLNDAVELMRPLFVDQAERSIPENLRVTVGFPSRRALSRKNQAIGECWSDSQSRDQHFEIFISPLLSEPAVVLSTLVHEVCHAVAGLKAKHGAGFRKVAIAVGLEGKMTATTAGEELAAELERIASRLPAYPHASLDPTQIERKKQGTRMLKAECPMCDFVVRVARGPVEKHGPPHCPEHGAMDVEGFDHNDAHDDDDEE